MKPAGDSSKRESGDFTEQHYRHLIRIAKDQYQFARYSAIPWDQRYFVLWRHDVDFSLNRSLALAQIETELGINSTYFVNIHSEFYNVQEKNQAAVIKEIIDLGHDIGLHFEVSFFEPSDQNSLEEALGRESRLLEDIFDMKISAFSFHNPTSLEFAYSDEIYAGLVNCYSKIFRERFGYVSDSNGYWRHERLLDVLTSGEHARLQVLTHPGWWQQKSMPPRERIFRAVYGRARAVMAAYDSDMQAFDRLNLTGVPAPLSLLAQRVSSKADFFDYQWNSGYESTLFVELWRLHESQIAKFCKAVFRKEWRVPAATVNSFFDVNGVQIDGWKLFEAVFEMPWYEASGFSREEHMRWVGVRNQLMHGRESFQDAILQEGCAYVASVINAVADWGLATALTYDGLAPLGSLGLATAETADGQLSGLLEEKLQIADPPLPKKLNTQWEQFKERLALEG